MVVGCKGGVIASCMALVAWSVDPRISKLSGTEQVRGLSLTSADIARIEREAKREMLGKSHEG